MGCCLLASYIIICECTIFKLCTEPEDFELLSVELEFLPDSSKVCSIVDINRDVTMEGNENFTAVLTANDPRVNLPPESATITIVDSECE